MKNTLLIDDDFDHLVDLAVALVEAGYQVIPKIDADSARRLIAFERRKTMKPQEVKAIAKRRGIGPGLMRKDELIKAPKSVGGNMMFWSEPSLQRNRFEFVQDGHEITVFDSAGKEG